MHIQEIHHPLIRHKLGLLRRSDISTKNFRELAQEVTMLLTYEATKDLPVEDFQIDGWAGKVTTQRMVGKKITIHYDPGDLRRVYISEEGKIVDVAYPIDLVANSTIRRDKAPEPHNESSSTLVSLQHLHDKLLEDKNHACDTKQN